KLTTALDAFNIVKPASYTYKPRIPHLYCSYQSTLTNIHFLAQLLNLADRFNPDRLIFGLQGSFIYNVTIECVGKQNPLEFIESDLLCDETPLNAYFRDLVKLVLKKSDRSLLLLNGGEEVDAFGAELPIVAKKEVPKERFF